MVLALSKRRVFFFHAPYGPAWKRGWGLNRHLLSISLLKIIKNGNCPAVQYNKGVYYIWFAPAIEGLPYVEGFATNWFSLTWPYMEFICTCICRRTRSSIVNWKIKLILQRGLLHMSISVEATGKYYTYNLCSICG